MLLFKYFHLYNEIVYSNLFSIVFALCYIETAVWQLMAYKDGYLTVPSGLLLQVLYQRTMHHALHQRVFQYQLSSF